MHIHKVTTGVLVPITVIPDSGEFRIILTSDRLKVYTKKPAQGGRANSEIISELREFFGTEIKINRGGTKRRKELFVKMNEAEFRSLISKLPGGENGENSAFNREVCDSCNTNGKRSGGKT